jgi:glycosyltransferase involved in cell wall biosynthesis
MAREYGVYGFCFYYYWFDGKRLLEKPLEAMLRSGTPDFPFCICWANENWTRTWDGKDTEVIIGQEHAPKSDLEFIYDILPMLRDSRYIRVDGKPLIAVYRTGLLPDTAATAAAWRKVCRDEGLGEIHLVAVRSFDKRDPRDDGFDAAIQFPPLQIPARNLAAEGTVATKKGFQGFVYDYEDAIRFSLREKSGGFPMYRGVMPAWDNTARRMERGSSWVNATPEKYGQWLREAAQLTVMEQPREQRLVFINAWNEWAEGTHLEPDERHGYALLEETAAAVGRYPTRSGTSNDQPILVISHDAHLAGAQMVTLATVRHWKQNNVPNVRIVCIGGGVLRPAFAAAYPTTVLEDLPTEEARRHAVEAAANFGGRPPSVVYSSTVINGPVLEWIKHLGMPVVTHVHELQNSIERWAPGEIMAATLRATDLFMAASPAICENLVARHGVDPSLARVVPAHIDCDVQAPAAAEVSHVRHSWQAGPTDIVVFGCGTTDWRKGPDLFCEIAVRASSVVPGLRFAWAGGDADYYREWLAARGLANTVHFLGTRGDVRNLLHAADIFLLSSREDPMPLVALEAAAASLPVVCFAGSGDIPSFVGNDAGMVVPPGDITAAAEAIVALARDPVRRHSLGRAGSDRVRATYDSRGVAGETLRLLHRAADGDRRWPVQSRPPLASVIVPNYQHAAYLPERLQSILAQDIGDIEIILLDDSSTDGSLELLEDFARSEPRARIVASETNSGSAFRQWRKGLSMAKGRYVWVAESDDSARSGLLRTLIESLESHPTAVLAYCQSEMIDERGGSLGLPLEWTADISPHRWLTPYMTAGCDEIATALIHKNTIPNVSAVLFRNTPHLPGVINEGMRLCGDWLAYVQLCGHGDVIYTPEPLNLWRQRTSHSRSRPAGELEWDEGRLVIRAAAAILGLDEAATRARLAAFRRRCRGWLAAAGGEVELV